MKAVLVILLALVAFVGGMFAGPSVLPKAEQKTGFDLGGRPFHSFPKVGESVVDLANALAGAKYKEAYAIMGPSYHARVSEAKFISAWEEWEKEVGRFIELGPRLVYDDRSREVEFTLRTKEGVDTKVTGTVERAGETMRFETCSVPRVK
jgi:hypothetical protein